MLYRRSRRVPENQIAVLFANLPAIEDDLNAGSVVVLAEDRIRVRRLPLR